VLLRPALFLLLYLQFALGGPFRTFCAKSILDARASDSRTTVMVMFFALNWQVGFARCLVRVSNPMLISIRTGDFFVKLRACRDR